MPIVTLANSIGQPTQEIVAQTHKQHIAPVIMGADGTVINPNLPQKTPETPVLEQQTAPKIPVKTPAPPQKSTQQMQEEERFAAIIRREKAMRAKVREYEERETKTRTQYEADLAAARAEAASAAEARQLQERLKDPENALNVLTDMGYTDDQITQMLLNKPGPESQLIRSLSAKISKMEQAQQEQFKRAQEEAKNNYDSALKTIESNVNKLVRQNPDEFEVLAANDAQKSVVSYIEKVWKEEGVILDTEEAAKEIEDYLTEKSLAVSKLKKIQARTGVKPPPRQAAAVQSQPSPTLTNKVKQSTRPLTARERAIQAFNQNRK
jgi:hypothetical protein